MQRLVLVAVCIMFAVLIPSSSAAREAVILAGTPYATEVYIRQGADGRPAAVILGGVHGNEPAGSRAAEIIAGWHVRKGTLVVVPRVNRLALEQGVRTLPEIGDVNRAYPGNSGGSPAERLAAAVIALVDQYQATMLIDLHEARTFHRLDKTSLGQMILFAPNEKSACLTLEAIEYINGRILEPHRKFTFGAHPIAGSGAWYAGQYRNIAAFTLETSGTQDLAERVEQHLGIVRYLVEAGGIELE